MAIVINTEAPDVGLVKNKIIYQITTDNYKTSVGVAAVYRVKIVSAPDNGDTLLVGWDEGGVAILIDVVSPTAAAADTTGTKVRDDQVTTTTFAAALALKLNENILLSTTYTIAAVTVDSIDYVQFTANEVGTKYDSWTTDLDSWHEWETVTSGANIVYDGNFYLTTQIYVKDDNGDFQYHATQLDKPKADQTVDVDVSELLKASVDDYVLPELDADTGFLQTSILREYRLLFFEQRPDGIGTYQPVGQLEGKFAWFAGITPEDFADNLDPMNDYFASNSSFLSWFKADAEVREDQQHFISFLNYDTSENQGGGS